jgi:hypothetical protein
LHDQKIRDAEYADVIRHPTFDFVREWKGSCENFAAEKINSPS